MCVPYQSTLYTSDWQSETSSWVRETGQAWGDNEWRQCPPPKRLELLRSNLQKLFRFRFDFVLMGFSEQIKDYININLWKVKGGVKVFYSKLVTHLLGLLVVSQRIDAFSKNQQWCIDVSCFFQTLSCILSLGTSLWASQIT